jgi:hypothetical protein
VRGFGCAPGAGFSFVGEPVIAWGVWVPGVKLPEFVQTARGEVVVWLLGPITTFRVVKPFDKVEDAAVVSASSFDTGHDFFNVVLLALLDIVGFSKYLGGVGWHTMFAGSKGFEQ